MSTAFNEVYFNTLEELENSQDDYNRIYSINALQKIGFTDKEAIDFCDDLESKWDIQVDYLVEVERENSPFHD